MKKYMNKRMRLAHTVNVKSTEHNETLLTWDRVNVSLTDEGKAAGLSVLFDLPIKKINVVVEAGDVGYIDIEFYGDPEDVRKELPEDLQCCWLMPKSRFPSDVDTFIVRCNLWALSVSASAPVPNGWAPAACDRAVTCPQTNAE